MSESTPTFGIAGAGDLFYARGYKKSLEVPGFLAGLGLDAFEYQCGRGVNIGEKTAQLLGSQAHDHHIALSVHAPYYISLAVEEEERREKTLGHFVKSAKAAKAMGAKRIVFHPGGIGKMTRAEACQMAENTLSYVMERLKEQNLGDLIYCPETMGKINQLGNLEEVLKLCRLHEHLLPCVDFGHLYARTHGEINGYDAYARIFEQIADVLGVEKAGSIHCHFSRIEYSTGGEKKHLTFSDTEFGPEYEPLMELLYKKGYTPVIICESAGTQAEDAQAMSAEYYRMAN